MTDSRLSRLSLPVLISSSFSLRIRSKRTDAGSSSEFCGTSLPRIARSKIFDFVVFTSAFNSSPLALIESILELCLFHLSNLHFYMNKKDSRKTRCTRKRRDAIYEYGFEF